MRIVCGQPDSKKSCTHLKNATLKSSTNLAKNVVRERRNKGKEKRIVNMQKMTLLMKQKVESGPMFDETESGADILKLLLHPCVLPFEVQNKLLFYLDSDEINILTKDKIKSKEGFKARPQFNIYDHAIDPIKYFVKNGTRGHCFK